jgi:hypothetical protein
MIVVHFTQAGGITKSGRLPNCTYSRIIAVQAGREGITKSGRLPNCTYIRMIVVHFRQAGGNHKIRQVAQLYLQQHDCSAFQAVREGITKPGRLPNCTYSRVFAVHIRQAGGITKPGRLPNCTYSTAE